MIEKMFKTISFILLLIFPMVTYASDYDTDLIGIEQMPYIIAVCLAVAAVGGLLYFIFKDNVEEDKSGSKGCLGILGLILVCLAGLGVVGVVWQLVCTLVLYPIIYIVSYVVSMVFKLILGFLAVSFVPLIFMAIVHGLLVKTKACDSVINIFMVIALVLGLSLDVYLYGLLPEDTITFRTFFPEWTLNERIDMQLHPEKYEDY